VDACTRELAIAADKLKELSRIGRELAATLPASGDGARIHDGDAEAACAELRTRCVRAEATLGERRAGLHRLLDLHDAAGAADRWREAAAAQVAADDGVDDAPGDLLSRIRRLDYLLSRFRELRLRSARDDVEAAAASSSISVPPRTLFAADDALERLEVSVAAVVRRREELRERALRYEEALIRALRRREPLQPYCLNAHP